ncbi:MAG: hypothetical protein ACRCWI_03370 [Brevinema sp.]
MLLLLGQCTRYEEKPNIPKYTQVRSLLTDTKKRPDLRVLYFRHYPNFWMNDSKGKLAFSEALFQTGHYQESLGLGYQLLLEPLSFFDRGKNYFIIAQNYEKSNKPKKARFYFDKAITRNNQYYFFIYARFEEFQKNFPQSIELYQTALDRGQKDYIVSAYTRTLYSAVIYYKKQDQVLYQKYLVLLEQNNPKTRVIKKALVL